MRSSEPRKLTRSRSDRKLAGVCGGIANYLNIDPTVVRVVYAILTVCTVFSGIIIYLILMLLMPEEN
ncbi:MAG: PspC domain-containing protein [Bacteroidaceae bacterium]|jgi:phage shock protein C